MAAPMWARRRLWGVRGEWRQKHEGVRHPKVLQLPSALGRAAESVLQEEGWNREQAKVLGKQLWGRRPPELWGAEKAREKPGPTVRYTAELARAYLAVRLERDHAAVGRALREIQLRVPAFAPQTMLDFGSGIGAACWVAHELWGHSLLQYLCVGSSRAMREMGERLRHGGAKPGPAHFGPVFARPFLPAEHKARWDLVVACFALGGLRGREGRQGMVRGLWRRSEAFMVLVEPGTPSGHRMLMEARDELLQGADSDAVQIFAPCPHRQPCPRLRRNQSCSFAQRFGPPPSLERELVSFLIARRVAATEPEVAATAPEAAATAPEVAAATAQGEATQSSCCVSAMEGGWARVTAPVRPRPRQVPLSLCCPDGVLRRVTVTAARHGRPLYRQARASRWGDLLPFPAVAQSDVTPAEAIKGSEE